MFEDSDFWLVLISMGISAVALAHWINKAGDDWLHSQLSQAPDDNDDTPRQDPEAPQR